MNLIIALVYLPHFYYNYYFNFMILHLLLVCFLAYYLIHLPVFQVFGKWWSYLSSGITTRTRWLNQQSVHQ
jgi:hypothetical protein